jgi:hypothetical protein
MRLMVAAAVLLGSTASAQVVTQMTPELVQQALTDTKTPGCYPLKMGGLMSFRTTIVGCYTTPYSRIAGAAQRARTKYQPFTVADVTDEMRRPVVEVIAFPQSEIAGMPLRERGMLSVLAVVVAPAKAKDRSAGVILPTAQAETGEEYVNAYGAKWEAKSITATFPMDVLRETNEIRVVYPANACADSKNKLYSECAVDLKLDKVK